MEFLDVINEQDDVVGRASIAEIYEKKLMHRIVHILLFHPDGRVALQLRSREKFFCPEHWSTPVGGHVQAGESYEVAALREYDEELGATSPLTWLGADPYESNSLKKIFGVFRTVSSGPFVLNEREVARVDFFTLPQIHAMIAAGEKFNPELLFLLDKYVFEKPLNGTLS
jgi:isopentenyldiphosphate isomerase